MVLEKISGVYRGSKKNLMIRYFCICIVAILCAGGTASARQVAVIQSLDVAPYNEALSGFRSVCAGKIMRLFVAGMGESDVVRSVRKSDADLILAIGNEAAKKVRDITDIPVVYMMILNPRHVVPDIGNVTGVGMTIRPETQLALLHKALPGFRRVGIIYDPVRTGAFVRKARSAASEKGIELVATEIRSARDFPALLEGMKDRIDVFWVLPDVTSVTAETFEFLILFSIRNRIPVIVFSSKYLASGALLSIEIDPYDIGRQAGEMAARILSGATVKDVPRTEARKAVLSINLKVAEKLGISFPDDVIAAAKVFNGGRR